MRAGPVHDQYARLPWLIAAMTVIVLAIGALATWYVENDLVASAPVRSMLWKLAAAWALVWLPMLGFSLWSARRLKQTWAQARDERAHAETAESKYRELVEHADDIIYRVDLNGYFTYINSTVTRYKGYTQYELLGRHFTEHIRPDAREAARRFYLRQFARKTPSTYYEFPVIKKDGGEIWFGQNVQLLIENDQPMGFQAVARDITERKRAEEALRSTTEFLQTLIQTSPLAIINLDSESNVTSWNRTAEEMLGWSEEEVFGKPLPYIPPGKEAEADAVWNESLQGLGVSGVEIRRRKKDGTPIDLAVWSRTIRNSQGAVVSSIGILVDITERKQAEAALRDSEMQMRLFMEATADCVWNWDMTTAFVTRNAGFLKLFGYAPEEVDPVIDWWAERVHPDDRERVFMTFRDAVASCSNTCVYEYRFRRRDGSYAVVSDRAFIIRDDAGTVVRALGAMTDITERKQAEEALIASEKRLRTIIEAEPECVKVTTEDCLVLDMNAAGLAAIEADSLDQVIGQSVCPLVAPAYRDAFAEFNRRVYRGEPGTMEYEIIGLKGRHRWMDTHAIPLRDERDTTIGVLAITRDVTERKREERITQALLEGTATVTGKQFFPALVRALAKGLEVRHALVTEMLEGEPCKLRILAMWTGDRLGSPAEYDLIHTPCEHVIKLGEAYYQHSVQDLFPQDKDLVALGAVSYLGIALSDSSGRTIGHLCIMDDKPLPERQHLGPPLRIFASRAAAELERKRAEEEVQRARAFLGSIVDNIPDMVFVKDAKDLRFVQFNRAGEELLGYRQRDLIGKTDHDLFPKEEADFFTGKDRTVLASNQLLDIPEEPVKTKHRGTRILHTKKIPILDKEGRPQYLLGISEDITERKKTEEVLEKSRQQLRDSETRYRNLFEYNPLMYFMLNAEGTVVSVNPQGAAQLGYTVSELTGQPVSAVFPTDLHPAVHGQLDVCLRESDHVHTWEITKVRKDGALLWVRETAVAIRDQHQDPLILIMCENITERKEAEKVRERLVAELAESRNRFEMFFRQTPSAIAITTIKEGRFLDVNKQAEILTGYSREELIGHTTVEMNLYVDPTERASVVQALKTKGVLSDLEREIRTKSGEIRTAIFSLVPILMGSEPCMLSIAHDITERKRAEEGLRERSRQQAIEAELSLLAVTAQDLPVLLQTAVELIANALEVNYCEVLERLPHSTQLRLCASAGWRGDRLGQVREAERGSLAQAAMHSNKPVVTQDFQADGRFGGPPWLGTQGVVSGLGVAIRSQEESWGVLAVYRAGTRAFSRDDANFIQTISNVLAAAIERKQADTVLQNANRALRTLSRQLLQVQEQERRTIARDLHDEIGQSLTAIKLNVERAQRARDRAARVRIMKDSIQITEHVLGQVRDLSLNLHPSILDDLGLTYALKWYADRQAKRAGLNVVVEASPSLPRLSPHLEIACFRIAQEALTNVARHAKAGRVNVTIKQGASSVELRVQDDGIGFDIDAVPPPSVGRTSVGLASMQERARLLGGLVRIVSRPGRGTTVIALLPLGLTAPDEIPETETSRS